MAITLVATAGASNANTYCTLAEAETYHESRTDDNGTWAGAADADKNIALAMATRLLDHLYTWYQWPSNTTQALQWPRNGMLDFLELSVIGSSTIPQQLKDATAEFARHLLEGDRTADYDVEAKGIKMLRAGPVTLEFKDAIYNKTMPDAVSMLIPAHWGYLRAGASTVELNTA